VSDPPSRPGGSLAGLPDTDPGSNGVTRCRWTGELIYPPATHTHVVTDDTRRQERLDRTPTPGRANSLWHWPEAKHPLRVVLNYIVIVVCRLLPSLRLKSWLFRRLGMTVGARVGWGLESTPDVFWPERITVRDDAIVGYDATILCHEFLQDEYRVGETVVGERAMVGAGAVLLPGVEVGADARVAANSLVAEDVPAGATVAGVPAEIVDGVESETPE
jgi:acetyltransferase-like isoleucine patch superfamily enzyme